MIYVLHGLNVNSESLRYSLILPSSYTVGDRFIQRLLQDSMTIVYYFERLTLFITFTSNLQLKAMIREALLSQKATDLSDLVI